MSNVLSSSVHDYCKSANEVVISVLRHKLKARMVWFPVILIQRTNNQAVRSYDRMWADHKWWKLMNTNFGIEPKMKGSWIHAVGNVDGVDTECIGNVVYGGGGGDYEGVGAIIGGGFWKRGGDGGSGKEVVVVALLQKGECMRNTIMVMPLSGYFVSKLLNLPSYYAAGLILVGCCPGGTASNIVTYIARGNVALSVLMTAASTLSAVIMTPFLTAKLAGQYVAVDAAGLLFSTLQVVLLPVLAGAFLNQYFEGLVKFVSPVMPPIAVATVGVLCGNAIAQSSSAILTSGKQVVLASALLHASGFFFGYIFSRMLGLDVTSSRTISIEVGMQNSVLGIVLAGQHFGNPLTAVPCAVSSVCHSILGSALAGFWRQTVPTQKQD